MDKPTPGPWDVKTRAEWERGFDFFAGPPGAYTFMADVEPADARLIAAAPELLEACQTFAEWLRREEEGYAGNERDTPEGEAAWHEWYMGNLRICALAQKQARAAIARATGEQHDQEQAMNETAKHFPPSIALPERDPLKPNSEQGLYRKFDVRRTDGSDHLGGKHYGCGQVWFELFCKLFCVAYEAVHSSPAAPRFRACKAEANAALTGAEGVRVEGTVRGDNPRKDEQ